MNWWKWNENTYFLDRQQFDTVVKSLQNPFITERCDQHLYAFSNSKLVHCTVLGQLFMTLWNIEVKHWSIYQAQVKLHFFISKKYIYSPNPMFYHLLESSHRDDSNKWSKIGFVNEITHIESIEVNFMHLIWCSDIYGQIKRNRWTLEDLGSCCDLS